MGMRMRVSTLISSNREHQASVPYREMYLNSFRVKSNELSSEPSKLGILAESMPSSCEDLLAIILSAVQYAVNVLLSYCRSITIAWRYLSVQPSFFPCRNQDEME